MFYLVNSNNAVLFGGAKGYSSNYDIKNDTYIFKIQENTWVKISPVGDIPPPRAAHSACAINEEHLAIFGGAGLAGELVPDDLYILEVSLNKSNCTWYKIPTEGPGPGKRYGHVIIYYEPYLLIFGGNLGNSLTNKVHYALINENNISQPIKWNILKTTDNSPVPPPCLFNL